VRAHLPMRGARPRRAAVNRLGAALASLFCVGLGARPAAAAPWIPDDDRVVLERIADPRSADARELANLQAARAAAPDELRPALALARRALELGRRDGDARLIGRAEAALTPWLQATEPPLEALVLHATVQQNRHEFASAEKTLAQILGRDPRNAQAWFTRAVVDLVQGDPQRSLDSCARLFGRVDSLWVSACASQASSRAGRLRESYETLGGQLASARDTPPAQRAWIELALGEMAARAGDSVAAETHIRSALAAGPNDAVARADLADLLLDLGRPAEVRALLGGETRSDILILRLALAEHALGDPQFETHARLLEARADEARLRGGNAVHAREEARLALEVRGDTARALELARANFAQQREPADARLLLEAARAANDPAAAEPALAWLTATGLEDARLAPLLVARRAS
jgi:tetratricopeptide (TPR) repeat protein